MSNNWDNNDRGNRDANFNNAYNSQKMQNSPDRQYPQQQPYNKMSNRQSSGQQVSPRDYINRDYGQDYSQDSRLDRDMNHGYKTNQNHEQTDHDATFRAGSDYGNYGRQDWDSFSQNDDRFAGGYGGRTHGATRESSGGRGLPGFGNQKGSSEFANPGGHWSYPSNAKMNAGDMTYTNQNSGSNWGSPNATSGDYQSNDIRSAGFNRDAQTNSANTAPNHAGRGPKNWKRSDERIKEDVSEALERHSEIDASEIEVNVKDGIVILTGAVEHRLTKRATEDVCAEVSGVKDVRNELSVNQSLFDQARELLTGETVRSTSAPTSTANRNTTGRTPRH